MIWLLIASLLWGPSFGLISILRAEHGMDPFTLGMLRMFYSLLLFLPLMHFRGIGRRLPLRLALLGAVQFGVMYVAYLEAFHYLRSPEVALCTVFTPLYVSLICNCQGRRFCPVTFFLVVLAIGGAMVIRWANPSSEHFWQGFALMQLSNLCFALGQVGYRKLAADREGFSDLRLFGWMYLGAYLVTLLTWSLDDPAASLQLIRSLPLQGWAIVLWLGLVPSGLAFFLWNHGAMRVNEGTLAIFNDLKIPIALAIIFLLFGQEQAGIHWVRFAAGAALMLLALGLNERWKHVTTQRESTLLDSDNIPA